MGICVMGYRLEKEEVMEELKCKGSLLEHEKTGAKIVVMESEDKNKVFSIGFRTPPADSTGVAHIVEHTVLCGSKEFPGKDPFVELVKGSLNTFLNAMTYSDKTVYPVASCNDKDFQNLMHVYLDAVFYPNIYRKKEIFMQEGWHYELESEEAPLTYNGVVYNEMKGVFSSPEQILFRTIQSSLFPDTAYGTESGGDPEFIPDLSYEEFLDFHGRYYHPSNSYIYLYGDMDVKEKLQWIDENYLSRFERISVDSELRMQKAFSCVKEIGGFYSLADEEEEENKTYLSYNTVVGTSLDKELYLAFQILQHALLDAPGAPLKQALLDAGIGRDILSSYENGILQPVFSIIAKETEEEKKKEFVKVITDTLEGIVEKGVEEKSLKAAINYFEFKYREADFGSYPKGLMYGLQILDSWLYDSGQPFLHICANDTIAFLKEQIGTGYFEGLIQKYLLLNTHGTVVVIKPKKGLTAEMEKKVEDELASYKKSLSLEEIHQLIEDSKKLEIFQEEPSTQEELEKIPLLSREDIGKEGEPFYNKERRIGKALVIHHEVETNGIGYLKLAFPLSGFLAYSSYLSLLSNVLGYVNTENYGYLDFSNEVNIHTGGIFTDVTIYKKREGADAYEMYFEVWAKVLFDELPKALSMIEEMLHHTILEDEKRLKEILAETRSKMQMKLNSAGHSMAASRAMSYFSESAYLSDRQNGIGYYQFLDDLYKGYEDKKQEIIETLSLLVKEVFTPERLVVSFGANEEGYQKLEKALPGFYDTLKEGSGSLADGKAAFVPAPEMLNEGLKTSGQVQYVARAGNFKEEGISYTGALKVLKVILSYDYLWNQVRVKGGAYGCMCGFSYDGSGYLVSYRDPNLRETNDIYKNTVKYLKNFDVSERDMTKYVIGAISNLDTPLTPSAKASRSFTAYICKISEEDIKKERREVLEAGVEDIRKLSETVGAILKKESICVIGNETKLKENADLFRNIRPLF